MRDVADLCFNPGLGFRSVATRHRPELYEQLREFQSRSGFSVRRDLTMSRRSSPTSICFNPGLGFRSVATLRTKAASIPQDCFNPGLGFRSVATR